MFQPIVPKMRSLSELDCIETAVLIFMHKKRHLIDPRLANVLDNLEASILEGRLPNSDQETIIERLITSGIDTSDGRITVPSVALRSQGNWPPVIEACFSVREMLKKDEEITLDRIKKKTGGDGRGLLKLIDVATLVGIAESIGVPWRLALPKERSRTVAEIRESLIPKFRMLDDPDPRVRAVISLSISNALKSAGHTWDDLFSSIPTTEATTPGATKTGASASKRISIQDIDCYEAAVARVLLVHDRAVERAGAKEFLAQAIDVMETGSMLTSVQVERLNLVLGAVNAAAEGRREDHPDLTSPGTCLRVIQACQSEFVQTKAFPIEEETVKELKGWIDTEGQLSQRRAFMLARIRNTISKTLGRDVGPAMPWADGSLATAAASK
jgi:hypothetical protein